MTLRVAAEAVQLNQRRGDEFGRVSTIFSKVERELRRARGRVSNNKIFSDTIKNFSAQAFRRVDCVAKVANTVDPMDAIARLRPVVARIPNVMTNPAPVIDLLEFTAEGPKLCVRPYYNNEHYWQVYFDTNRAVAGTFGAAAYPVPATPVLQLTK
jgi:small conductance mechanosensitive channel